MDFRYLFSKLYQRLGIGIILIFFISTHILIIIGNSSIVKYAIFEIEDDATLINRSGKIRGGVQRVAKLVLENKDEKEQVESIDSIFSEFLVEEKYRLVSFKMHSFVKKLEELKIEWINFKTIIDEYKLDQNIENKNRVLEKSEDIWYLSEDALKTVADLSASKMLILKITYVVFFIDFILILFIMYLINKNIRHKLEVLSKKDSLTKINNRNSYNERLKIELESCSRYKNSFSYIMFDIDFFKSINDNYGHDKGDDVLKSIAKLVEENIRLSDDIFRIGGEEFVILAKGLDKKTLAIFCEKIRKKVEEFDFNLGKQITISLGATIYKDEDDENIIYKRADEALYSAKNSGRNKTVII